MRSGLGRATGSHPDSRSCRFAATNSRIITAGRSSGLTEANAQIEAANELLSKPGLPDADKLRVSTDKKVAQARAHIALAELLALDMQYNSGRPNIPGRFRAVAPPLVNPNRGNQWTVLTDDRRENLVGKTLRPNEELMRLGNLEGPWHIELKIPPRSVGPVLKAFADDASHFIENDPAKGACKYLVVDVLLSSHPETTYEGRLYRDEIAATAVPNPDEVGKQSVVIAYVKLNLPGLPKDKWVPTNQLVVGLEAGIKFRFGAAETVSIFESVRVVPTRNYPFQPAASSPSSRSVRHFALPPAFRNSSSSTSIGL